MGLQLTRRESLRRGSTGDAGVEVSAGYRTCHAQELVKCEAQVQCRPLNIKSGAQGVRTELDSWPGVPSILMALIAIGSTKPQKM